MNKKVLSLLLTIAMVIGLFPAAAFAANENAHGCDSSAYCIVCDVAGKINALPAAEEIDVNNAARVTDEIHAIDRLKVELTDAQYDELLKLVEAGNDGSGYGGDVPLRYINAVEAVQKLGGNSLYIAKKFIADDGSKVNVDNAEVQFEVTNVETNASQILTMSTMSAEPGTLCADADFYSMNAEEDGWTFKYILPAGTYKVEEVSDFGATVNGEKFVTTEVTYDGIASEGATVTVNEGQAANLIISNTVQSYKITLIDQSGNPISGATITPSSGEEGDVFVEGAAGVYTEREAGITPYNYGVVIWTIEHPDYQTKYVQYYSADAEVDAEYLKDVESTVTLTPVTDVTINFVGRDGQPIIVDGEYTFGTADGDGDGAIDMVWAGEFYEQSSYKMENLLDGFYDISLNNIYGNGYSGSGYIMFKIADGKIVEHYDEIMEDYLPDSNSHTILNWDESSITVEVQSITYGFSVGVMGIDAALGYVVKNEAGVEVAWDKSAMEEVSGEDAVRDGVHLDPGTYTFHSITDENFKDVISFPAENEYVTFTVNGDYTVTVNSDEYTTEIEDYGSSYTLKWYLEPTKTVTVTATISTSDGTNFPDDTIITLYTVDSYDEASEEFYYSEVHSIAVPTDVNTFTYTWTTATYETETNEEGNLVEITYRVAGTDSEWNEIYFSPEESNVWTATIAGRGVEFETAVDAGYYSETADSENKVGVIALNAMISSFEAIKDKIVKFGMLLYRGDVLEGVDTWSVEDEAGGKLDELKQYDGAFHAIVNNISEDDFNTTFSGIPFVVVDADSNSETTDDRSTYTGEAVTASVGDYYNWMGNANPYN